MRTDQKRSLWGNK